MEMLYQRCCGLDVQQTTVGACVRVPGQGWKRTSEVRTFETTTAALLHLADWLTEQGITHVAIESTGVYWLQSRGGLLRLPLFQNGACPFPCTPLLSILMLVTHTWREIVPMLPCFRIVAVSMKRL
jgi:hypothetical protein